MRISYDSVLQEFIVSTRSWFWVLGSWFWVLGVVRGSEC